MEAPTDPSPLIMEVYHNLLQNIFKWDRLRVIGSIRLVDIKETIQDYGQFWQFWAGHVTRVTAKPSADLSAKNTVMAMPDS